MPESPVRYRHTLREARAAAADAAGSAHPRSALHQAMGHLAGAFQRHLSDCEKAEGLLPVVAADAPRLTSAVEALLREHREISENIQHLRRRLSAEYGPSPETKEEILALLDLLAEHDQRESGLMLDAYNVDVGEGD